MSKTENLTEPYSEAAEKAVLGAILLDPPSIKAVKDTLTPDDFHHSAHQAIYAAMLDVHESGSVVTLTTVTERLKQRKRFATSGGSAYIMTLEADAASSVGIEHHAAIIKEKSTLRRIVAEAKQIIAQAMEPAAKPDKIPTKLSIEIAKPTEVCPAAMIMRQLIKHIEIGYPGLYPCYDILARTIRKVSPGHLWVVGAYTSVGKSAWLCDFICRMYRHGLDNPGIAIFSTEMSCEQYLVRILSNETGLSGWNITENTMKADKRADLVRAQVYYSERNLYLYDRLYKYEDIERTARKLKERRLDILCIDYLQNMWGEGKIYDRMSRLAPLLQYLAKELQVTIIALSQVSNEHAKEKETKIYGYKGAGEIAAAADLGIELVRDPQRKEFLSFRVEKNRHGSVDDAYLKYINNFTRLNEVKEM